jgi:SEC-C motif-containing protein
MTQDICPCRVREDDKREFAACCGPYLARTAAAPTAEALMRSRYSAFVKADIDYLRETLSEDQRETFDRESTENWAKSSDWQGIDILETEEGREGDETGTVTFTAHFIHKGKPLPHKEKSRFKREGEDRRWYFAGEISIKNAPVVLGERAGRNDPCPCGSGKKYKKCCGAAA